VSRNASVHLPRESFRPEGKPFEVLRVTLERPTDVIDDDPRQTRILRRLRDDVLQHATLAGIVRSQDNRELSGIERRSISETNFGQTVDMIYGSVICDSARYPSRKGIRRRCLRPFYVLKSALVHGCPGCSALCPSAIVRCRPLSSTALSRPRLATFLLQTGPKHRRFQCRRRKKKACVSLYAG
jgi:hypothetical protein